MNLTGSPAIMIVDDIPANLQLLQALLLKQGYRVQAFPCGRLALAAAAREPPDLILLDIAMPEMNGFEVCSRLKSDAKLAGVPVIFLTAHQETIDKVRAFGCGGVDYITKPFEIAEVQARVETHLALRRQQSELQESYVRLKELEQVRDNLTHLIVHDMRSPLGVILMSLEMLKMRTAGLGEREVGLVDKAWRSSAALLDFVNQLLDINRLESGQMPLNKTECDLPKTIQAVVDSMAPLFSECRVVVVAREPLAAVCDGAVFRRVLENLIGNALRYTPAGGEISVSVDREGTDARVAVADQGPGIPAEYHQRIFEKFVQVEGEQRRKGSGLGLAFCKLAVGAHGGRIGVESEVGKGSRFWFTLPLERPLES
jgi:signal transduction histidine kinase